MSHVVLSKTMSLLTDTIQKKQKLNFKIAKSNWVEHKKSGIFTLKFSCVTYNQAGCIMIESRFKGALTLGIQVTLRESSQWPFPW